MCMYTFSLCFNYRESKWPCPIGPETFELAVAHPNVDFLKVFHLFSFRSFDLLFSIF